MAVTQVWNIVQMDAYPTEDGEVDVVFNVHWTLTGEQTVGGEPVTGSVYGSQGITLDAEAPFIPYNQLTLAQVITWVQEAMGAEQVAAYEANVAQQIQDKINPPVITPPLPWQTLEAPAGTTTPV